MMMIRRVPAARAAAASSVPMQVAFYLPSLQNELVHRRCGVVPGEGRAVRSAAVAIT